MIIGRSDLSDLERKEDYADKRIRMDGYGSRRHPSRWMVRLPGDPRWHRVYVCCISNAGTAYVEVPDKEDGRKRKNWHVIEG